jgi:hypothetical protein
MCRMFAGNEHIADEIYAPPEPDIGLNKGDRNVLIVKRFKRANS